MHICMDEIMAFWYALPVLGVALLWAKTRIASWRKKERHK